MAVNLVKGENVDLTKGNAGLNNLIVGLGWDTNKNSSSDFDLDAEVFLLDESGKVTNDSDFVFYGNLAHSSQCVVHLGDNVTGEGDGDDEVIDVILSKIPENISKINFTVTIYEAEARGQNFGQISNAYIRVINKNNNQELFRFDLVEDFSFETALVVAEIYRHEEEWKFNAIGNGFKGGLKDLCQNFGVDILN